MGIILLDRTIQVHRLTEVGYNRQAYTTYTTTLQCTIQPLGDEKTAMAGGSFGKMFKIYLDEGRNVKEGDKILDRDGHWYKVIAGGVENRNDGFMADYLGLTVQKIN